ncbi:MAG TPA: hypothetical protein VN903_13840 [Polyangia bacterium]|jgi:hypothetical protein|nr:hypothetical protein [Polyangia bacterium]
MRSSVLLLLLGIAIAVNGCGGSSSGGAGGKGGANGGGAGTSGGAGACGVVSGVPASGATCNAVAAGGPCVVATFSTAAAPMPAGGAFAAGTYNLVSQTLYGPADAEPTFQPGQPFRQTYALSDVTSTSFTLDQAWASGDFVARAHLTAVVSGMTATFVQTCPPPDAGGDSSGSPTFTATSTSLTLFWPLVPPVDGIIAVNVFNKAP